jgi:hypothetical protein
VPADKDESYESCDWSYPDKRGCTVQTTCYADGVPYSCNHETCTDWGDPVKANCKWVTSHYTWQGCIGARPPAYHDKIGDATSVRYPGFLWGCGPAMLDLTTSKSDAKSAVDSLYPTGNTNIPSGLIWAWNMLTPEVPLTESAATAELTAKGGKKVMVLMTDGANSTSPYDNGSYGNHADTSYGDGSYTDNLTAMLCEKIKSQGVTVYTVLFDVTDPGIESLLRNCASDPANSFVASNASELIAAFNNIGVSLTKLRLVK